MNSKQYRQLAHATRKLGLRLPPKEEFQRAISKTTEPPLVDPSPYRSALQRGWTIVGFLATIGGLVALIQLRPHVSVDPVTSTDESAPFQQLFYVTNESYFGIKAVQPQCRIVEARLGTNMVRDIDTSAGKPIDLPSGAKTTARCLFPAVNGHPNFTTLDIEIQVPYKAFRIEQCEGYKYVGRRTVEGKYIWTPNGGSSCTRMRETKY
jgi:hypothetical protein